MRRKRKLSTTVSEDNYRYLQRQVTTGEAANLSDAVDRAVRRSRKLEMRLRLARDTAAYFANLSDDAVIEENKLGEMLGESAYEVNFES